MLVSQRHHFDAMNPYRHDPSYPHGLSTMYAIPAQRTYGRDGVQGSDGLSYAEHELLRSRKTPYGRIHEQFEPTSLDKNVHVPASKHVLLSVSPQRSNTYKSYHDHRYRPSHLERAANLGGGHIHIRNATHPQHPDSGRTTWDFVGGYDSVLQQSIAINDQKIFYHPGSQIPTVLPATLHGYIGPTASAGQQFYGPYWPDGTFSPYHPAPIRDSRFFGPNPGFQPSQAVHVADVRTLRRSRRLPVTRDTNFNFPDAGIARHEPTQEYLPFYDRVFSSLPSSLSLSQDVSFASTFKSPSSSGTGLPTSFHEPRVSLYPVPASRITSLQPNEASDRIAFRDRTFSWAHHTYVELLDRIQSENKLGRPVSGAYSHAKLVTKPAFFPRPPQRTGSSFTDPYRPPQDTNSRRGKIETDNRLRAREDDGGRPQTAIHSTQHRATTHKTFATNHTQNTKSLYQYPQYTEPLNMHLPPDPRLCTISNEYLRSPLPAAASALETMELLCEEAETPWTDGMLLAGCLAYGLGNYARALDWYQKILIQDPRHVEAMSNLAATLLALGKRNEALQHWSTAVKLRPSYFEAVEHLIGLLCNANRAKEAVEIIEFVESCLKLPGKDDLLRNSDLMSDGESETHSRSSSTTTGTVYEQGVFDYDTERCVSTDSPNAIHQAPGFGSSGYAIPGSDNGRLLALIHAKGNILYGLGHNEEASNSFEEAILIATGHRKSGVKGLIRLILLSCISCLDHYSPSLMDENSKEPILLSPDKAQQMVQRMFPLTEELPGLEFVSKGLPFKAAISTTSNSLLSLAKIYQDGMGNATIRSGHRTRGTREILALYYLSLSLQPSPSTANNVGILLASVQQATNVQSTPQSSTNQIINYAGIAPGSGIALALQYYNYGLNIDSKHAHLYTNLGSLLKDLGQLNSAIKMYEIAVQCDGNFDIALANLANAVKDQGRIAEAINYYRRAVQANPEFAEAVCGLATALNSVCNWYGRGGIYADGGSRDPIHVDEHGQMQEARKGCGWINRVVEIVDKQLKDGENWGLGTLTSPVVDQMCQQLASSQAHLSTEVQQRFCQLLRSALQAWAGRRWEGARIVRLVERAIRRIGWQWYQDRYKAGKEYSPRRYSRPLLPTKLSAPTAPTVLPFHTFTTPLSAKQVRQISQRNALRISVAALRSPWLPPTVYPPPRPPAPCLKVGYVSSDFNNHPLAHLMQSIFGLHDTSRVHAVCYATTSSDGSTHRHQIEREAPSFHDASTWSIEKLVNQIVEDGIHILVNLNGYTRGAKNEVFAARPAPIHMSFMGFAGTLGAEWCDYVFADSISVLPKTLSPWRRNVDIEDRLHPDALVEDEEDWMYAENVIFAKSTFFCVDHKQSAPDADAHPPARQDQTSLDLAWRAEQDRRWQLRKELFPTLPDSAVILGNFNQLYKIDPSTFRMYLRILAGVPNAILWLLRFPDIGEQNLKSFAREWAGEEVASRIVFTDVAPKGTHITRASVVDLFLDTPECNAHTTAADVIWSGTPIVTWARWDYKMCSRMASSIVASALPENSQGDEARKELLVDSNERYEKQAIDLASNLRYPASGDLVGRGKGRLIELRRMLWEGRWTSRLFDTKRWVKDIEAAYWEAWKKWESGEGGDIWL